MLLYYIIVALHVLVCLILTLVVLLQSGKGADLAGAFGGGGTQTAFGSRGPASFLSKATTGAAIVFMITSILLSGLSTRSAASSVMDGTKAGVAAPAPKLPSAPAGTKGDTKVLTPEEIQKRQAEAEAKQKQPPAPPAAPVVKETPPAAKEVPPAAKKAPMDQRPT
jgi:preprotein translocase subunit SecG